MLDLGFFESGGYETTPGREGASGSFAMAEQEVEKRRGVAASRAGTAAK